MLKANKLKETQTPAEQSQGFTGIARSVIAFNNQGHNNFKILTLYIEFGQVKDVKESDPYANWEAISRLELSNQISILNLNNHWEHGKALAK